MPPANSTMLDLGTACPDFDLPDFGVNGEDGAKRVSCAGVAGKPLVVMFICNHCPFVKHIAAELSRLGADAAKDGVTVLAVSSNNIETHPADAPEKMTEEARAQGWSFPYLYDESQEVAKAFSAACTPDFFVFDADLKLAYRGQLDDSRPDSGIPVTGADLRAAIKAVAHGSSPSGEQKPSIGCGIKWKPDNAPAYA